MWEIEVINVVGMSRDKEISERRKCVDEVARVLLFFLQAEDSIGVAQESRGLGEVYKGQPEIRVEG